MVVQPVAVTEPPPGVGATTVSPGPPGGATTVVVPEPGCPGGGWGPGAFCAHTTPVCSAHAAKKEVARVRFMESSRARTRWGRLHDCTRAGGTVTSSEPVTKTL